MEADLGSVRWDGLALRWGAVRIHMVLGKPSGDIPVRFVGGAKTIRLERPRRAPVRLRVVGGSGGVILDGTTLGRKGGDTTLESNGWSGAKDRYSVEVVGGSKTIEVVSRPD
jgi:hypothetical protein